MSRVVEQALKGVKESKFNFLDNRTIEVMDAHIFWTNFRGEENRFKNDARTFNLALGPEMAGILKEQGFRIREYEEGDDILFFINIKVNMNSAYPPIISLFSEFKGKKNKRRLDIGSIGELDRIDIKSADLIFNVYESPQFPGKLSGYLKKLNVIQEPDIEFGGKYDDWLDEEYDCLAAGTCSIEEYRIIQEERARRKDNEYGDV